MPFQPPRFGRQPAHRPKWAVSAGQHDRRKRGRAGQRDRRQVLAEEPLCRRCLAAGRESPSEEVDHIVPLEAGGSDRRSNKQGLCKPCHADKTRTEAAARRG